MKEYLQKTKNTSEPQSVCSINANTVKKASFTKVTYSI